MHTEQILAEILNTASQMDIEYTEVTWGFYRKQFLEARDQVLSAMIDEENEG